MKLRSIALAAAAGLVLLPGTTAATASDLDSGNVCTIGSQAVPLGEQPPVDAPLVVSCFETEAEAEKFIESGAPGDVEQLGGDRTQARGAGALSTVTIGKVWTGSSRGGSELIHWGTGSGCYGVTYGFPTLPAGWNDNIRSAQGYSNCWASHYSGSSYSGNVLTCAPYCATLGFLDAQSSSIVYRPVGTFG